MTTQSLSPVEKRFRKMIMDESAASRVSLTEAAATVKTEGGVDPKFVDQALAALLAKQRENVDIDSAVLDPSTFLPWYLGPSENGQWAHYLARLHEANAPGLDTLDRETSAITGLLADPVQTGAKRKGLVMGNVQSGKTRNFAGVIAKAADAHYKFVIVLSGINNNLREQTQTRLNRDLFEATDWYPLTNAESDFSGVMRPGTLFDRQKLLCAVVKKNTVRLRRLVKMMEDIPFEVRRKTPVLIIDDEADQATPNSLAEQKRISTINRRLRDLWSTVVTGTYVAYTATPFANVLMDPDNESDLFPSDFVTTIEPGEGYYGAERVFGISDTVNEGNESDGLGMVREIPMADASSLKPPGDAERRDSFDPELPDSLRAAFRWFVVATAIRRARGQREAHSSMLVHTTHYTLPHFALQKRLVSYRTELLRGLDTVTRELLFHAWKDEAHEVASEATQPLPSWEDIWLEVPGVLRDLTVIVDNGHSEDRLNYEDKGLPQTVVAVGGGTLSRGLTLEGLVVSYFTRTSNTYDTLLQMGRWFGYRPGYEDLPRVWVTKGLDEDYAYLARVEKDLRDEIASVQATEYTPRQLGVRVRAHPGRLEVTSKNKMFSADIVQLGLSGTSHQTFLLDGSPSVIQENLSAAGRLTADVQFAPLGSAGGRWIARGASGERVAQFIENFRAHSDQRWLTDPVRSGATIRWIERWAVDDAWNLVLVGSGETEGLDRESLYVGEQELTCLQRTPLRGSTLERLNLKALTSPTDRVADIDPSAYEAELARTEAGRRRIRRTAGAGQGLLLLYALGSRAQAPQDSDSRMDMPTSEPMLGFAVVFPHVDDADRDEGTFVSVRRYWDVPLTVEGDEDLQEDEEEMDVVVE